MIGFLLQFNFHSKSILYKFSTWAIASLSNPFQPLYFAYLINRDSLQSTCLTPPNFSKTFYHQTSRLLTRNDSISKLNINTSISQNQNSTMIKKFQNILVSLLVIWPAFSHTLLDKTRLIRHHSNPVGVPECRWIGTFLESAFNIMDIGFPKHPHGTLSMALSRIEIKWEDNTQNFHKCMTFHT